MTSDSNHYKTGGLHHYFAAIASILAKDLRFESRSKELLRIWVAFGLFTYVVFLSTGNAQELTEQSGISFFWVTVALLSTIGLYRSFAEEVELGTWTNLLMSPVDHSTIYFAKFLSNLMVCLIAEIPMVAVYMILVGLPYNLGMFLLSLLLGSACMMSVGTLLAAFVIQKSYNELALPIMMLPIVSPVINLASQLMKSAMSGHVVGIGEMVIIYLIGYVVIILMGAGAAFSMITELY
jgi:heme exporter protein B